MATEASVAAERGVATAATEVDVVHVVREACGQGTPLRLLGGGTWSGAGRPVSAERTLDLSPLRGIVEYVPGDLTLTARAGTTLAEIDEATRAHGQWLPLDPFGTPSGTLGATLATASAGPLASSIGLPRDVALGVTFVDGRGRVVRGGGRVVKNVAGFDLVRLTVGAWGTLGVLTEATVRLRGVPEADESVALALPMEPGALAALLRGVRQAPVAPLAAELVSTTLATRLGVGPGPALLVRLGGNAEAVKAQRAELARLAAVAEVPAAVWQRLRDSEPASAATFRLSASPSDLGRLWADAVATVERLGGEAHGSLERGIVRCWLPAADIGELEAALAGIGVSCTRIFERLPAAAWPRLAPAVAADRLGRALRDAFDPQRILNRGLFGEERR